MNILFLCTGNSCRSIIAEALLQSMAPPGVTGQSAGSQPTGFVHSRALTVLQKAGLPTEGLASKSWHDLPQKPDAEITLCASAAAESCPLYFGSVVRSHWGMPDPAKVQGNEATIQAAFSKTFAVLHQCIGTLAKELAPEPDIEAARLQDLLNTIASL